MSKIALDFLRKLNNNKESTWEFLRIGFGLTNLQDFFLFHLDRFGVRLLGKDKDDGTWSEYYLEFGEEIITFTRLKEYILKFQQSI